MKRFHKDENTNSEINKQQTNTIVNGSIITEPQVSTSEQQTDQK